MIPYFVKIGETKLGLVVDTLSEDMLSVLSTYTDTESRVYTSWADRSACVLSWDEALTSYPEETKKILACLPPHMRGISEK